MIGKQITPILSEIADAIIEAQINKIKPEYPIEAFKASLLIFNDIMIERIWALQEKENIAFKDRCSMVEQFGEDFRKLIKTYSDIDTFELFK